MNHEPSDDLSAPERRAYGDLSRAGSSAGSPPELEDRIVTELRRQGLIRSGASRSGLAAWLGRLAQLPAAPRYALAAAAMAGIFFLGVETGKRASEPSMPEASVEPTPEDTPEPVDYGGEMMATTDSSAPVGVMVKHVCADAPDGEPHICSLADGESFLIASN